MSRLSAGVAEDEQLARAAGDSEAAEGDPGEWWTGEPSCGEAGISAGGVRRDNGYGGMGTFGSVTVAREMAVEDAVYIARFDPNRTLRQVEAFRKVLERHAEAERDSVLSDRDAGFEAGLYAALECLASIYTDEVEETP